MQILRPRYTVLAVRTRCFISVADAASQHARKHLNLGEKSGGLRADTAAVVAAEDARIAASCRLALGAAKVCLVMWNCRSRL